MPPVKKVLAWLVVIFLGYAIYAQPAAAADMVGTAWDITYTSVQNIFVFFSYLLN